MFRGCWYIVLAIGLATLPLESRAQVDEQETRGSADQQQHPAELTPLPIIVIEDEAAAEARRVLRVRRRHVCLGSRLCKNCFRAP